MFCTTECCSCEDKNCEHYISKEKLYFENQQLKERINKAIEHLELKQIRYLNEPEYKICTLDLQEIKDILKTL